MSLLNKINACREEELDSVITEALNKINETSEKEKLLGFGVFPFVTFVHQGFISLDSRIKYSNLGMESYSMKTTDYFYEFARLLKNANINTTGSMVNNIEVFINRYFGLNKYSYDARSTILNDIAWNTSTTDDEYFEKLDNNTLGDLKGKNVAMCTERAAVAQNLLSLFGIESYYCMGCFDNNGKEEGHAFNIAKAKSSYMLLDYSQPCPIIQDERIVGHLPFQAPIGLTEIDDVLSNKTSKEFASYAWLKTEEGIKKVPTGETRRYVVGTFEFKQEYDNDKNSSK